MGVNYFRDGLQWYGPLVTVQESLISLYEHRTLRPAKGTRGLLVLAYLTLNIGGVAFALSLIAIVVAGVQL